MTCLLYSGSLPKKREYYLIKARRRSETKKEDMEETTANKAMEYVSLINWCGNFGKTDENGIARFNKHTETIALRIYFK
ncbi:hypothetical protein CHCC15290_2350 [Bacillus licheniformis]|jgi:hypothetical protein|nr:hypothetical protein MUY_000244 [Bacillus licheniformis WX-02]AMR08900.1 hypothetical protein AB684_01385 [Bacillus licheniformis]APJ25565.1 hypothetical protein BSZ43_01425 [Bacillus sp. H15-1]ASV13892.1 hypothetical protein CJO35_01430 [Bacillus sp. 1s-1]MBY8348892.1 hypothetical protein [Bacillus sp. PCH94]NBB45516.1 hypothetical protein [Bacillus sp. y1(2019)]